MPGCSIFPVVAGDLENCVYAEVRGERSMGDATHCRLGSWSLSETGEEWIIVSLVRV